MDGTDRHTRRPTVAKHVRRLRLPSASTVGAARRTGRTATALAVCTACRSNRCACRTCRAVCFLAYTVAHRTILVRNTSGLNSGCLSDHANAGCRKSTWPCFLLLTREIEFFFSLLSVTCPPSHKSACHALSPVQSVRTLAGGGVAQSAAALFARRRHFAKIAPTALASSSQLQRN